jgi:hypothetical protein
VLRVGRIDRDALGMGVDPVPAGRSLHLASALFERHQLAAAILDALNPRLLSRG